jgi:hypothetical protein
MSPAGQPPPQAVPPAGQSGLGRWRKLVQGSEYPGGVDGERVRASPGEHCLAVGQVLVRETPDFQQQEEGRCGTINPRARPTAEERDLLLPPPDTADEVVGGGVDGFDRQTRGSGELHQLTPLFLRTSQTHEVDVLGDSARFEPQGDQGASNEQPVAFQALGHGGEQFVEALPAQLFGHGSTISAMDDAWEVLAANGLPEGPIRPAPRRLADPVQLRAAVAAVASRSDEIDEWHVEPLLAWLRGFKHHWPERFATILGLAGEDCLASLGALPADPNRYLKLRRIAIENLSHML